MAKSKLELITLDAAVEQWLRHCSSRMLRPNTLSGYRVVARQFVAYAGATTVMSRITRDDIEGFLVHVQAELVSPAGVAPRPPRQRSPKTVQNMHTALSSLWTWAVERKVAKVHVVRQVKRPHVPLKPVVPLSAQQVVLLINACDKTDPWDTKPLTRSSRPTAVRDKAIISLAVESCLRVSELANLRIKDVKTGNRGGQVYVRDGKGGKDRTVPFSAKANGYIGDYLMTRRGADKDDYLIINEQRNYGLPMTRGTLAKLIRRIGRRAKVDVHPHLLRTTGACMLVQHGASAWEVQRIMGHSEIVTTQRYVQAAAIDLQAAMARSSPMDHLRL
ncbi:MAG: tyrosine-type recombinase/integrase [Chloroflexi bacterium]|nr:tyrosine-type recombinase/integrase [Chloroflexota bacterium]